MSATVQTELAGPFRAASATLRHRWPGVVALSSSVAALYLCLAAVGNTAMQMDYVAPAWWQFIRIAGFAGFWLACLGALLGAAMLLAAIRRGSRKWLGMLAVGFSLAALGVVALGVGRFHVPPYWLQDPREPSTAQLNALSPKSVVRAYYTSQDLSVQYRLSDTVGRAAMTEPHDYLPGELYLLAGVDDLRIRPLRGPHATNATHRSFEVTFTSRAPDVTDAPSPAQQIVVDLVRKPRGSWRVSYDPGL